MAGLTASAVCRNHSCHSIRLLLFNPFPNPGSSSFSQIFLDAPCKTYLEVEVCDDSQGVGLTWKINHNIDLELASLLAQDSGSQDYRCETPPLLVWYNFLSSFLETAFLVVCESGWVGEYAVYIVVGIHSTDRFGVPAFLVCRCDLL